MLIILAALFGMRAVQQQAKQSADNILNIYETNIRHALDRADTDLRAILYDTSYINQLANPLPLNRHNATHHVLEQLNQRLEGATYTDAYVVAERTYDHFLLARSQKIPYAMVAEIQRYIRERFADTEKKDSGWMVVSIAGQDFFAHYYYFGNNLVCAFVRLDTIGGIYRSLFEKDTRLVLSTPGGAELLTEGTLAEGPQQISVSRQIPICDLVLTVHTDTKVDMLLRTIPAILILVGGVALLFILFFTVYTNREIISPMRSMMNATRIIEGGDIAFRSRLSCRNREFRALSTSLNSMLDMIVALRIDSYERVIQYQGMELKYRQLQLRPHFFLNALTSIHSLSYKGNGERIRQFIDALSKNIRYMFKAGLHTVTVREEIEHIRSYLLCQDLLYPGALFSYIEVAPETERQQIPQLLLHTFVENIYKYVVSVDTMTTLLIKTEPAELDNRPAVRITVEDDGAGFPPEVLAQINGADNAGDITGRRIGLLNISRTLRLLYDRGGLLHLSNKEEGGAMVRVLIPDRVKGEEEAGNEAEAADCG